MLLNSVSNVVVKTIIVNKRYDILELRKKGMKQCESAQQLTVHKQLFCRNIFIKMKFIMYYVCLRYFFSFCMDTYLYVYTGRQN